MTKDDIPESRAYARHLKTSYNNTENYFYKAGTNGITYHSIIFPCQPLTKEEFNIASLYSSTLTDVGIGNKNYEEVQKIQSAVTGGISANFILLPNENRTEHSLAIKVTSKSLEKNENKMQDLMIEMVSKAKFTDKNRIKDMLTFIASDNDKSVIQNGHVLAMSNAAAQINNISSTNDIASGINFITNTGALAREINNDLSLNKYLELLKNIKSKIVSQPIFTFTSSSLDMDQTQLNFDFNSENTSQMPQSYFDIQEASIGWITGAQVSYCAEAFPTVDAFHEDAPALSVLGAVLRNGYLHSAIREKGGAYGAGAMQDSKNQVFKFFSYRDPKCTETFNEFRNSREWSLKGISQNQLDEGILGVISSIDKPLSPYGEAMSDFANNLDRKSIDQRLRFRALVKECSLKDLENVSRKYLFNESKKAVTVSYTHLTLPTTPYV